MKYIVVFSILCYKIYSYHYQCYVMIYYYHDQWYVKIYAVITINIVVGDILLSWSMLCYDKYIYHDQCYGLRYIIIMINIVLWYI